MLRADLARVARTGPPAVLAAATIALGLIWWAAASPSSRTNTLIGLACAAVLAIVMASGVLRPGSLAGQALSGWWGRHWKPAVGLWGLALALAALALVWRDQAETKASVGYATALMRIESSRELAARLGQPVRPGWWVGGGMEPISSKANGGERGWLLKFSVSGPKGSGRVCARAACAPGERELSQSVLVTLDGSGERLELVKPRLMRKSR